MKILDDLGGPGTLAPLGAIRQRLGVKLRAKASYSPLVSTHSFAPRATHWVNEYLLGVMTECESESELRCAPEAADRPKNLRSNREAKNAEANDRTRRAAARALNHYNNALALHPHSYWGHYRAAAIAFGLGGTTNIAEAAGHLEQCLKRRPRNPMLHNDLAACLMELNQNHEALEESEKAIEAAPDLAELYRTRAFIRTTLGPNDDIGLAEDLQHFEILRHLLPRAFSGATLVNPDQSSWSKTTYLSRFPASLDIGTLVGNPSTELAGYGIKTEVDPQESSPHDPRSRRGFVMPANTISRRSNWIRS